MNRILRRTSVTVDEAVLILVDRADGPIVFRPSSEDASLEEHKEADSMRISLIEELEEERESLASDLAEAKFDKRDAADIESKRQALEHHDATIALANKYLCAIHDELNKGKDSALRVDLAQSTGAYREITLVSLDEWAKNNGFSRGIFRPELTTADKTEEPTQQGDENSRKGGLSRTKTAHLRVSFAFLVDEFIRLKGSALFCHDDSSPKVMNIAEYLHDLIKKTCGPDNLKGLSAENIKQHIEDAMDEKQSRVPKRLP